MRDGNGYQPTEPTKTPPPKTPRKDGMADSEYYITPGGLPPLSPEELIDSIADRKMMIDAIGREIDKLKKRKDDQERWLAQDQAELLTVMHANGEKKIETGRGRAYIHRSKSLQVRDMDELMKEYPEYFKIVSETKFQRQKMKDDMLKNGVASDFAYIEERESVVVK